LMVGWAISLSRTDLARLTCCSRRSSRTPTDR
jgi:hypothetical protein